MKKVFLVLISLILTVSSMVALSACGDTSVGVKIPSYKVEEMMLSEAEIRLWDDDAEIRTDNTIQEDKKITTYVNDGSFLNYCGLGFYIDSSKVAGEEIICMEIDITSETDVEGYLYIHGGGAGTFVDFYDKYEYELKAGEKKTFSIEFKETLVVKKSSQDQMFLLTFRTDLNEGGSSWKEWTKVKYNISRIEIGVAGE